MVDKTTGQVPLASLLFSSHNIYVHVVHFDLVGTRRRLIVYILNKSNDQSACSMHAAKLFFAVYTAGQRTAEASSIVPDTHGRW